MRVFSSRGSPGIHFAALADTRSRNSSEILESGDGNLEELVHIRAFGKTEAECLPLTTSLGRALHEHYGLDDPPEIYLNGKPLPESPLNEEGVGS